MGEHTSVTWARRECSWEKEAAFMWPGRGGGGGGTRGGRNFRSCLQISLRERKAPGEHLWAESSPTLFPLLPLFSLWRLDLLASTRGYLFQDNIWNKPKRGSMRTLRGSHRHLWSWRGGMYRFFVKLTFLIPAIVISQGKMFPKQICEHELWALKELEDPILAAQLSFCARTITLQPIHATNVCCKMIKAVWHFKTCAHWLAGAESCTVGPHARELLYFDHCVLRPTSF